MKFTLEIELGDELSSEQMSVGEVTEAVRSILGPIEYGGHYHTGDYGEIKNYDGKIVGKWEVIA